MNKVASHVSVTRLLLVFRYSCRVKWESHKAKLMKQGKHGFAQIQAQVTGFNGGLDPCPNVKSKSLAISYSCVYPGTPVPLYDEESQTFRVGVSPNYLLLNDHYAACGADLLKETVESLQRNLRACASGRI
eukprot:GHVU01157208.1.p1 GENE.GHVU01157208.1~~GHVU01157208.1.p1  ORF type:complete len:131 (-),score=3.49 GHVU01157208.1:1255-1647(-)